MKGMSIMKIFEEMIRLADCVGTICEALMYENGFMSVSGVRADGSKFAFTLNVEEKTHD